MDTIVAFRHGLNKVGQLNAYGNPAKVVRWRFDETIRAVLSESAWWDWPETEIRDIVDKLCSDDLAGSINYVRSRPSHGA